MEGKQSEYARLLIEIDMRNRAVAKAMSDFAAVANHASINARMEREAGPVMQLFEQGRFEDGVALWHAWIDLEQGGATI